MEAELVNGSPQPSYGIKGVHSELKHKVGAERKKKTTEKKRKKTKKK